MFSYQAVWAGKVTGAAMHEASIYCPWRILKFVTRYTSVYGQEITDLGGSVLNLPDGVRCLVSFFKITDLGGSVLLPDCVLNVPDDRLNGGNLVDRLLQVGLKFPGQCKFQRKICKQRAEGERERERKRERESQKEGERGKR